MRAAVFLCMVPLDAAESMRLIAMRSFSSVSSAPASAASMTARVRVRISPRIARLRRLRFSFCRLRLIALLMFATAASTSKLSGPVTRASR